MLELFTPFNPEAAFDRALPAVRECLRSITRVSPPDNEGLVEELAGIIVDYAEEMARCHGQEHKCALRYVEDFHSHLYIMERVGILEGDCITHMDDVLCARLYDELRRCGIGKCNGYCADIEEARG